MGHLILSVFRTGRPLKLSLPTKMRTEGNTDDRNKRLNKYHRLSRLSISGRGRVTP